MVNGESLNDILKKAVLRKKKKDTHELELIIGIITLIGSILAVLKSLDILYIALAVDVMIIPIYVYGFNHLYRITKYFDILPLPYNKMSDKQEDFITHELPLFSRCVIFPERELFLQFLGSLYIGKSELEERMKVMDTEGLISDIRNKVRMKREITNAEIFAVNLLLFEPFLSDVSKMIDIDFYGDIKYLVTKCSLKDGKSINEVFEAKDSEELANRIDNCVFQRNLHHI